jgi:hypothetical protein
MTAPTSPPDAEPVPAEHLPDFWADAARLRAEAARRGGSDGSDLVREERDRRALETTGGSPRITGLVGPLAEP